MNPYAIIETGGKQYMVRPGERLKVEKLSCKEGATIDLQPVLAMTGDDGLMIGTPAVENAKVKAEVLEHVRGPKVIAFKKKRRKGYKKKIGHRQDLTVLKVQSIDR